MGQRNSWHKTSDLQNRFTAYLRVALKRKKCDYISKQKELRLHEFLTDSPGEKVTDAAPQDMLDGFPLLMRLEDLALMRALEHLTARERYILFERILGERSYEELCEPLGLRYYGVSAAYHRIINKLRKELGGKNGI